MNVPVSTCSPRAARPAGPPSPVSPHSQRPTPALPCMRMALRALALVIALAVTAALASGSTQAAASAGGGAPAPLPVILLPGRNAAALAALTITCPKDISAGNDIGSCSARVPFAATAEPATGCRLVGIAYAIGGKQVTSPFNFAVGTTTVQAGAQDSCGNTAVCEFRVTVRDVQTPVITCPAGGSVNADSGHCNANVGWPAATATDNCSVASLKYYLGPNEITSPHVFPVGTSTITAEARDPSGNWSSCTFQITVRDVTPPTVHCPENISQSAAANLCSANATYAASASDNCPPTLTCAPASGSAFPVGTTNVTCTARDPSNNSASCTFRVTVRDTQPPLLTCPANVTTGTDPGRCNARVTMGALASDNCTLASLRYYADQTQISDPYVFTVGTTDVLVEARDPTDNSAQCMFSVRVMDVEPPTITCPANITVNAPGGGCTASVPFAATAADNCSLASLKYYDGATQISSPRDFAPGTTTVRAEAMDGNGNTASCTFQVTVRDTVPPTIACPADRVVSADGGRCSADVSFAATAGDNCALASLRYFRDATEIGSPYAFPLGTTSVRAEARDAGNNTASCVFQVTVRDTQPPSISCPSSLQVQTDPGRCDARVTLASPATDNCAVDSLRYFLDSTEIGNPHTFSLGTTTVRAEARDAAGNLASCTFPVIVRDAQPPNVSCPPDMAVSTDPGRCSATVPFTATATDNCGIAWLRYYTGTTEIYSPYTLTLGTHTIRAVASDTNNTGECSFRVTVRDSRGPSITCPPTVRTVPDPGRDYASGVAVGTATATDPCSVPAVSALRGDGQGLADPYPLGRTIITWTARDAAGNSSSCTQDVWVGGGPLPLYLPCLLKQ